MSKLLQYVIGCGGTINAQALDTFQPDDVNSAFKLGLIVGINLGDGRWVYSVTPTGRSAA